METHTLVCSHERGMDSTCHDCGRAWCWDCGARLTEIMQGYDMPDGGYWCKACGAKYEKPAKT